MDNPLIQPILSILEACDKGISEFDLLRQLEHEAPIFDELGSDPDLKLFRKHFLIMNALYQLQRKLWQEDEVRLYISPLKIHFEAAVQIEESQSSEVEDGVEAKLAAYYLDWNEYDNTNAEDVAALLKGFYNKLFNRDDTNKALQLLGIKENATKTEIKRAYRLLVRNAHPDKGGDTKKFIKLRKAYEHLISQSYT
ncbi:molecular chaperone DnaJ [Marinomonas sp. 42_23_T18]|mgnify:FL=1|nr:molecular chaperone DnaJ [Marinomonas sp. 42_23_T18]